MSHAGEMQHHIPPRLDQTQPRGRGRGLVTDARAGKGSPAAAATQVGDALWAGAGPGMVWERRKRLPRSEVSPQPQEGQSEARGSSSLL